MLRRLSGYLGELCSTLMPERSFQFLFLHILSVREEYIFEEMLSYQCAHFALITGSSKQNS
jgi:hypothetical protein